MPLFRTSVADRPILPIAQFRLDVIDSLHTASIQAYKWPNNNGGSFHAAEKFSHRRFGHTDERDMHARFDFRDDDTSSGARFSRHVHTCMRTLSRRSACSTLGDSECDYFSRSSRKMLFTFLRILGRLSGNIPQIAAAPDARDHSRVPFSFGRIRGKLKFREKQ